MKILFIDSAHPALKKELEKNNFSCYEDFTSSKEEIEKNTSSYNGIVLRSRISIDKKFIDSFFSSSSAVNGSQFIARVGAGMEHIDVQYAESRNIKCINSAEGNSSAVAEHALGMLLSLFNNLCKANAEVKNGTWSREPNRGTELEGKTVGIYGYGNTGSSFVNKLKGFNVRILAFDRYKKDFGNDFVKESTPEEIASEADILSLHLPLTSDTNYLVNDAFINTFRKNIYLINTSRGPIVKTDDLVKNMRYGKILGACLDVLEYEETSFELISLLRGGKEIANPTWEYLKSSAKIILTPHIAGWSFESSEKMARILAKKIGSVLS